MKISRHASVDRMRLRCAELLAVRLRELYDSGDFKRSLQVAKRALTIVERVLPPGAPEIFDGRRNVAELLRVNRQPQAAEAELRNVMAAEIELNRIGDMGFSETCNNLATCLIDQERFSEAAQYLKQSISVLEQLPEPDLQRIVVAYKNLGVVAARSEAYSDAVQAYHRSFELALKHRSDGVTGAGDALENLVLYLLRSGRISEAESAVLQAEATMKDVELPGDTLAQQIMMCRGELSKEQFNPQQAAEWYRRALAQSTKNAGTRYGLSLRLHAATNLAAGYSELGMFNEAVQTAKLALHEAANRANYDKGELAALHLNLGRVLRHAGQHYQARKCLNDVLRLQAELPHPDIEDTVEVLENLALLSGTQGRSSEAIQSIERALALGQGKRIEPYFIQQTLHNYGFLLAHVGDYARAEEILLKALTPDFTSSLSPRKTASTIHNLGSLYKEKGEIAKAMECYRRALDQIAAVTGNAMSLETTAIWNNLGTLAHKRRQYDEAVRCYSNALAANRSGHDDTHPESVSTLFNLSAVQWAKGNWKQSLELRIQGVHGSLMRLPVLLNGGLENDRRHAVKDLRGRIYSTLSFHFANQRDREKSARVAATLIVQVKGRALDAMAYDLAALRACKDDAIDQLLLRLQRARHCRADLSLRSRPATALRRQARLKRIQLYEEQIWEQLQQRILVSDRMQESATLEQVMAAVPHAAAVIEYTRYGVFRADSAEWHGYRYCALILRKDRSPEVVDIGDDQEIGDQAHALHVALRHSNGSYSGPARRLYDMVFQPVLPYLAGTTELFIVPDSMLNAVPFAVLLDPQEQHLLQHYVASYLSSARDLVREFTGPRQAPVIVIDDQDARIKQGVTRDMEAALKFLPDARIVRNYEEARQQILQMHGPRVVHFAMHGAFLTEETDRRLLRNATELPAEEQGMVHAVLALSDGGRLQVLLTALEAASLDLQGTQLVVMASCESGVGMVLSGEGIYGFRRALTLAGAAAQFATLWRVETLSIAELVTRFYCEAQSQPAAVALALAQRALAMREAWSHPHYWAPVILSCGPQALQLQKVAGESVPIS